MDSQAADIREKVRQQFDTGPYPRIPIEQTPKEEPNSLFIHNLVTAYYLKTQKVIDTEGKVILDAGCGTGYKALALAEANPKAKIVGIDFSEESVKLARQRLEYHGFENAEFHTLAIEDLPSLGLQFDYINNDDVLYLLADPVAGLKAMKSVLQPEGIIRSNLHSSLQRIGFYRCQEVFNMMGLMDENPREFEIEVVREVMNSLKDNVNLKAITWSLQKAQSEDLFLANYLLVNDKGYTVPEMFSILRSSGLEFVSMVLFNGWDLMELFKEPNNLPTFLAMSLPNISVEERLHLFELLHPIHRLLDFWCGHPNSAKPVVPVAEWKESDWHRAIVHLHPQLRKTGVKADLIDCIASYKTFEISRHLSITTTEPIWIDSTKAACLLPLWEQAQPFKSLVERWLKIRSIDPVTLEPMSETQATLEVKQLLSSLEVFLYVLLEREAS
jgi:ubiquinone/menaquinone biosynthesis C-methylase UbiE